MQKILRVILALCIAMMAITAFAQDEMTTLEIDDTDLAIMFPEDWQQETTDDGVIELTTDGLMMMVYTPDVLAELFEVDDADTPEAMLEAVLEDVSVAEDVELSVDDIKAGELDERADARITFETDDVTGAVVTLTLSDDTIALVEFVITTDDVESLDELTETIDEVVTSFDVAGDDLTSAISESVDGAEACMVNTPQSGSVQVRVGPGFNRTVIAFLPASVDFEAIGQATDDDGNIWFRVDEAQAAPGKAVNETWIQADDVIQEGDCDSVVDAAAPPVIPIIQQPTAVPETEAGDTDESTPADTTEDVPAQEPASSGATVDANGNFILEQGTWFLQLNNGTVQCAGGVVSGQTSPTTGSFTNELIGGGTAGFTFDIFFFQYRGVNTYQAAEVFSTSDGGEVVESLTLNMTSPRSGTGNLGYVVGSCTYASPITINYIGG